MYTSRDSIIWQRDAAYAYYKHGPLSTVTLGQLLVQQLNYSYTVQGWVKGVNTASIGNAAGSGTAGPAVNPYPAAAPAYGYSLHYYPGDYAAIHATTPAEPDILGGFITAGIAPNGLFNGNICAMAVNIPALGATDTAASARQLVYGYQYDQLNRIVQMDAYSGLATNGTFTPVQLSDYAERAVYDPNGNITQYKRNGDPSQDNPVIMDSLGYNYTAGTNRLDHITDSVPAGSYPDDIDNQAPANYLYDAIGNLTHNTQAGIDTIYWTVYGKIDSIAKYSGTDSAVGIKYIYDAAGNRISKAVTKSDTTVSTIYVRDASGNVMSIYTAGNIGVNSGDLTQSEIDIYGSSRVGMYFTKTDVQNIVNYAITLPDGTIADTSSFTRGNVNYELTNHLGNVLVTVSDKKLAVDTSGDHVIDYYNADVVHAQDYYPFGMPEPGRQFNAGSLYPYGFNGKRMDNDIDGVGVDYDYGNRIQDTRTGRFLSTDPLVEQFPQLTPYQFASNSPIVNVDVDGGEAKYYTVYTTEISFYEKSTKLSITSHEDVAKDAGWHMGGQKAFPVPYYKKEGWMGSGTLYTIYHRKIDIHWDAKQGKTVQTESTVQVGSIYVPPPPKPETDGPESSMPFNVMVFGSGTDPEETTGDRPNPNGKTISMNWGEFQEILGPILLAMDPSDPKMNIVPEESDELKDELGEKGYELLLKFGKDKLNEAIEKMDDEWKGEHGKSSQQHSQRGGIIYKREDTYGQCPNCEAKGSLQHQSYVSDSVTHINRAKDNSGVDTFYIKQPSIH